MTISIQFNPKIYSQKDPAPIIKNSLVYAPEMALSIPEILERILYFSITSKNDFLNLNFVCKFFSKIIDKCLEILFLSPRFEENTLYKDAKDIKNFLKSLKTIKIKDYRDLNYLIFLLNNIFQGNLARGNAHNLIFTFLNYFNTQNINKKIEYIDKVGIFQKIKIQNQKNVGEREISFIYHKLIDYSMQSSHPRLDLFLENASVIPETNSPRERIIGSNIIIQVCKDNDEKKVQALVKSKMFDEYFFGPEQNILHWAVENKNLKYLKIFIEEKVNLNKKNTNGFTPLIACLSKPEIDEIDLEIITTLIEGGADTNATDSSENSALSLASKWGLLDIVKILLEKGVPKQHQNLSLETPQHLAAINGHLNIILLFLKDSSINFEMRNYLGDSVLHAAAKWGQDEIINALKSKNDIDLDINLSTNLLSQEISDTFIERKIDIDSKNKYGESPLISLAKSHYSNTFSLLLNLQADKESIDNRKWRPLHHAAKTGNLYAINELLKIKTEIDSKNIDNDTPLIVAAIHRQSEAVKILLQASQFNPLENEIDRNKIRQYIKKFSLEIIKIFAAHFKKKFKEKYLIEPTLDFMNFIFSKSHLYLQRRLISNNQQSRETLPENI